MNDEKNHLYATDSEILQISHEEYASLIEESEEAKHLQTVKDAVLSDLQHFIGGGIAEKSETISEPSSAEPEAEFSEPEVPSAEPEAEFSEPEALSTEPEAEFSEPEVPSTEPEAQFEESESQPSEEEAPEIEKVSVDFSAEEPEASQQPDPQQEPFTSVSHTRADISEVPSIKQGIVEHFNKLDESGRLSNVFKQYYTCLNEMCGGTVRVTMKDGFCSFWNYDEWEEFAFVDIFEGQLRVAVDPSYTDALKSLCLCEVPRLISNRRNVICVKIDDLNNVVLDVLAKAFSEVGMKVQ